MDNENKNKKITDSLFMVPKNQGKDDRSSIESVEDVFQIGEPQFKSSSSANWTQPGISGDTYSKDHPREKDYSGIGPKGYHRSDEKIYEDVCEALLKDSQIDAQNIVVNVEEAVVMLSGRVSSLEMKKKVTQLVSDLAGVNKVENQLSIIKGVLSNDEDLFLSSDDASFH